ncbi:hypothetical protein A9K71_10805 [Mesorhizobium sp. WSM3873]|nr:hypothetical protein A9K71_10805 [Mesorhizobium sp. WSM3873]
MDFLPVDSRLGAGLEQIGFDQTKCLQLLPRLRGKVNALLSRQISPHLPMPAGQARAARALLEAFSGQARDVVQHEAAGERGRHGRNFGVGRQAFVSMLIIIMHIILLDAVCKTG